MSKSRMTLGALALVGAVAMIGAAAPQDDPNAAAISKQASAFVEAYARGDAAALAKFWAPEGEYVDLDGRVLRGRDAIEQDFREFFANNEGLTLRIDILSVRFPTPDVAVESGVTTVLGADGVLPSRAAYVNVLRKRDGAWQLWSVHESPYIPPSRYEHLRPLEWMIGEWGEDRDGEGLAHVVFDWSPDRNFILSTRSVLVGDTMLDNGTERIGWDPVARLIRSWSFETDGGFGEGTWTRNGTTWTSRTSAVLGAGGVMTSTAVMTRVDRDTITWQMKNIVVNGKAMPDSPLRTMKRIG